MKKKRKEKKKSKPEKEKKTITLEKSTFTQRERKTKIQQIVKLTKTKHTKGQQTKIEKHVSKMNFQDNLHK